MGSNRKIAFLVFVCLLAVSLAKGQEVLHVRAGTEDGLQNFETIQEAVDAAAPGATIYVYPGLYDGFILRKAVKILGAGFNRAGSSGNPPPGSLTRVGSTVRLVNNASNAELSGLSLATVSVESVDNIFISGCALDRLQLQRTNNVIVESCFFENSTSYYSFGSAVGVADTVSAIFNQCMFVNPYSSSRHGTGYSVGHHSSTSSPSTAFYRTDLSFTRCVFSLSTIFPWGGGEVNYENCIFLNYNNRGTEYSVSVNSGQYVATTVNRSVFVGEQSGSDNSSLDANRYQVDPESIFVGWPINNGSAYSFDTRFQLSPNSPARGFASDGGDCGPYGGPTPYVPSGTPSIPWIYNLSVPTANPTEESINVNVKVRTQN